jgi:hypothetical protein
MASKTLSTETSEQPSGLLRKSGELFLNEEVFHARTAKTFYGIVKLTNAERQLDEGEP